MLAPGPRRQRLLALEHLLLQMPSGQPPSRLAEVAAHHLHHGLGERDFDVRIEHLLLA